MTPVRTARTPTSAPAAPRATRRDQIATPYTNAFLHGATANIEIQKRTVRSITEHLGLTYSQNSAQLVLNALDPSVSMRSTHR